MKIGHGNSGSAGDELVLLAASLSLSVPFNATQY